MDIRNKVFAGLLGLLCSITAWSFSGEVTVGLGSYSTVLPPGATDVQPTIYKTANVTGKMPTNDWWSSTAWLQYSERQYPHPLAVQNSANGLRIYYPGPGITGNSACVCAWMNDDGRDLVIGHSATTTFAAANVDGHNDWFVTNTFVNGAASLKVSYGHGSPYVYADYAGGTPRVYFPGTPSVWSGSAGTPVLGVTVNGRHYALFGRGGSTWSGIGTTTLTNNSSGYFSVALLPDNSAATLAKFRQYAYSFVTNTQVSWSYDKSASRVNTTYAYSTTAREGTQTGTLFALYPHQWKNSGNTLTSYTYASVRGVMKVGEGTSFSTSMKFSGVLPGLPTLGSYNTATLATYVNQAAAEVYNGPWDTYWFGKRLGKLATLAPIADAVGNAAAATQFRNEIRAGLEKWLKSSNSSGGIKGSELFYYNPNWGTLIGYQASYGSDVELNDHHFHYGYFLKAAAEVGRVDKNWVADANWGGMLKLLARDIASTNRGDPLFPFLRNFDIYAGHTWASGHAKFGDGNNNESSSEAMNAWAGLVLLGEAKGDTAMRDLGVYLYTTEMNAINEYWFDVSGANHHPDFTRATASMIWGGKTVGDGVWWTANPEEVHGINWLPITAASLYLTQYPSYTQANYNALVSENGGTGWDVWSDLIWMYRGIHDPAGAVSAIDSSLGSLVPEAGNSRANTYQWVQTLNAAGTTDLNVTANHPLYAVLRKGTALTRIAYNMSGSAASVMFSDGATLSVPANSFAVSGGTSSSTSSSGGSSTSTSSSSTSSSSTSSSSGGGAVSVDSGGPGASPFVADVSFSGGATAAVANAIDTSLLSSPVPAQSVLQSERYGTSTYTFGGFTAGTARQVTLYFAENYWTAPNQRRFNVVLNGVTVLANFDVFANTGARFKAIQQNFSTVANPSGQVVIQFQTVTDNAVVNAIRVQ
jgi:endoglucanase Acf2